MKAEVKAGTGQAELTNWGAYRANSKNESALPPAAAGEHHGTTATNKFKGMTETAGRRRLIILHNTTASHINEPRIKKKFC
jgi:hypothetical protein